MFERMVAEEPRKRSRHDLLWTSTTYFGEGLPWSFLHQMGTEFLTALRVSNSQIAATSLLHLAVTFKFAWSPALDLFGRRRTWVWVLQLVLGGGMLAVAALAPSRQFDRVLVRGLRAGHRSRDPRHRVRRLLPAGAGPARAGALLGDAARGVPAGHDRGRVGARLPGRQDQLADRVRRGGRADDRRRAGERRGHAAPARAPRRGCARRARPKPAPRRARERHFWKPSRRSSVSRRRRPSWRSCSRTGWATS